MEFGSIFEYKHKLSTIANAVTSRHSFRDGAKSVCAYHEMPHACPFVFVGASYALLLAGPLHAARWTIGTVSLIPLGPIRPKP